MRVRARHALLQPCRHMYKMQTKLHAHVLLLIQKCSASLSSDSCMHLILFFWSCPIEPLDYYTPASCSYNIQMCNSSASGMSSQFSKSCFLDQSLCDGYFVWFFSCLQSLLFWVNWSMLDCYIFVAFVGSMEIKSSLVCHCNGSVLLESFQFWKIYISWTATLRTKMGFVIGHACVAEWYFLFFFLLVPHREWYVIFFCIKTNLVFSWLA